MQLPPQSIESRVQEETDIAHGEPGNAADLVVAKALLELEPGDFLLNVSVDVGSVDLIDYCLERGIAYLDTCIEPWANYYDNTGIPEEQRTNYYLRHRALEARTSFPKNGPSALLTHGANPGLITHFIKQALLDVANLTGNDAAKPTTREGWAKLMQKTGTKVIHVAEHDLQVTNVPKRQGEFCNTWSIPGFVGEGSQPAELGWGTHERRIPENGAEHKVGCKAAIYLRQPGCITEVRSWTPVGGPMIGFLITHGESITTADYFTVRDSARPISLATSSQVRCHGVSTSRIASAAAARAPGAIASAISTLAA